MVRACVPPRCSVPRVRSLRQGWRQLAVEQSVLQLGAIDLHVSCKRQTEPTFYTDYLNLHLLTRVDKNMPASTLPIHGRPPPAKGLHILG